jgi:hypothetical protein
MITRLVSIMDEHGTVEMDQVPHALRGLAYYLESQTKALDQTPLKVTHKFAHGLYYREILIPAGTVMSGRIHKHDDMQVIYYGDMEIVTDGAVMRVAGPTSFVSKAGTKQWGHAFTDTLWATVHATDLTDLDKIEKELFEEEQHCFDFVTGGEVQKCLPL